MGILLSRLLIILNDKDPGSTEYFIAFTLLMNFYSISEMSITEVAKICCVSKSTISKFIRSINFEDYSEFKAASIFKENKSGFNLNYNQNIVEHIENKGIDSYIDIIHRDINEFKKNIDLKKIEKLAKYLMEYKKVASFGLLFSEIAALDLQTKLAYNGKFILTNLDDVKQDIFIKKSKDDTLVIIYSNSGLYLQKYLLSEFQLTKNFSSTKAKIVLITSNKEMENYPNVDLCILFNHVSNIQTHSIIYQLINDIIIIKYRELSRV